MDLACDAGAFNAKGDPRYIFLLRASTRLWLVDNCEMTLDEACDGLVDTQSCSCSHQIVERWERDYPPMRRPKKRAA
jgi:hypothetical protein